VTAGDWTGDRSRGQTRKQSEQQEQDEHGQAEWDRMRLLAMRRRHVQRKAARQAEGGAKIPSSGGSPIGAELRQRMEPQLGADLSSVRIHTSTESADASDKLGARAFTTGSDVHFGAGEFAPGTKEGDRLIAHELTHAVQAQKSGIQRKEQHEQGHGDEAHGHDVSQPGDPAEQEADSVADGVAENLHGGKKVDAAKPGAQQAPQIGAKLSGRKIFRAGKNPLKGAQKDKMGAGPEAGAMHVGNAVQAGVVQPPQHHVFPQEKRPWFKERGLDFDAYCVNVDQALHEAIHKLGWNEKVMSLLRDTEKAKGKGKKLTPAEMIAAVRPLMAANKLGALPFVQYGSPRPESK
jgi:hypothetical protein